MDRNDAARLARTLMKENDLGSWFFEFDRSKLRFGACFHNRRTISLSAPLVTLNDEAEVRNCILHEIAHALTPGAGHGPRWKAQARAIGARPERCYSREEVKEVEGRYKAVCPGCGHVAVAHRKIKKRYACTKCCRTHNGGRFDARFELIFQPNTRNFVEPVAKVAAHSVKSSTTAGPSGNLCRDCGAVIPPTGKRGRPAVRCVNCR